MLIGMSGGVGGGGGVPQKNLFVGMVSIISGNTLLLINVTYIK